MTVTSNSVVVTAIAGGTGITPAPQTLTGFLASNPQVQVTATLVSAQTAMQLNNVGTFVGLLATYQIQGGYTVDQVVIGGLGGLAGNTFGLLTGYFYDAGGQAITLTYTRTGTLSVSTLPYDIYIQILAGSGINGTDPTLLIGKSWYFDSGFAQVASAFAGYQILPGTYTFVA